VPDLDLVCICDWLPPDFGAVGQYALMSATERAEQGEAVALVGLSSAGSSLETRRVGRGSLTILKLHAEPYRKTATAERLLWTAKTNTRLLRAAWPLMRRAKAVMFTGSPPLLLHWIAPANLLLRRRLIYRITDFHPECSIAEQGRPSLLLRAIYRATLFWRRRVHEFEVLGRDQAERLRDIGIPAGRIRYKPDAAPVQVSPDTKPMPRPPGAEGKHLLLYSGNWGVAHDTGTFIEGYARHHRSGSGNVVLWLNAVGGGAQAVEQALQSSGLPYIRGRPVPLEHLGALLITADSHLITLSDAFVGFVLPSKVHGCIVSGKPVTFIGSARSDVHRLCAQSGNAYQRVDVGDAADLARALDQLTRGDLVPGRRHAGGDR
jgi:hypothetical protein